MQDSQVIYNENSKKNMQWNNDKDKSHWGHD
jgi:hypothetical protein